MEYKTLNKKAISCMRTNTLIWSLILVAIAAIVLVILNYNNVDIPTFVYIILGVLLVLTILDIVISPIIRYKRYRYLIDDEMVSVVEGLYFIEKSIAPIERIHQISVQRGPIDRFYGLSKVLVTTAGGIIKISFLEDDAAEDIAKKLQHRINKIVAEQGVNDNA